MLLNELKEIHKIRDDQKRKMDNMNFKDFNGEKLMVNQRCSSRKW